MSDEKDAKDAKDADIKIEKLKKDRKRHNEDLVERMKKGEPLSSFTAQSSWFPPRPIIEKDKQLVAILHGGDKKEAPKLQVLSFKTENDGE